MAKCRMDCIERHLSILFEKIGMFIGTHPWWFLITPLLLSALLGSGFYFLPRRMSNDIEEEFTPANGPAKAEREYIQETFPADESMFSRLRLSMDGTYATLIATSDVNILTVESLQELLQLDSKIRSMDVEFGNQSFKYANICAEVIGSCVSNDFLDLIKYNASYIDALTLTFPWYDYGSIRVPLYLSLGSVEVNEESSVVESAHAIQLYYYLQESNTPKTDLWLEKFLDTLSSEPSTHIQVSYATSMSLQWEFEKTPKSVIPLFSITYAIAITFSITSCWRLDNVRTKVWVAWCGVFSTGLSILSGFGALLLLGQPFVMPAASCPFLILGIGIDDMFIMIACWQRTCVMDSVPMRLGHTYREAAISITITSLTDALAFFLGFISPFGSVQSFCLYAGICVCFCYLYNITFLGACMALNGQREEGNRHWFTCSVVPDSPAENSNACSICCVGGKYDKSSEKEETEFVSHLFEKFYGPFLTHKLTKVLVLVIYMGYLAAGIYGCMILKEGLDIKNLALDGSYVIDYYDDQRLHFTGYSAIAMVAVTQPLDYWSETEWDRLQSCISNFERLSFVNNTIAWFNSFQQYADANNLDISSQEAFLTHLSQFLRLAPMFRQDINFTADGEIRASRFFVQTLDNASEKDMMTGLRKIAEECPVKMLVYHAAFIYFDQYTVIVDNTIQTILVAVCVMLVVALLLIPSLLCSLWVAFAVLSVIVGVSGFMALWDVNLDSISMINLVMSIGFSVDFSAHISYSFVTSPKHNPNQKAIDALAHLGYPVLQGAVSTILGVVVLSVSGSYIFRTFFKVVFLVITFGLVHGLVFIPVFLTLLRCC